MIYNELSLFLSIRGLDSQANESIHIGIRGFFVKFEVNGT